MDYQNGDSGQVLKQQLRELYAEIESTKNVQLELLRAIWPDRLYGVQPSESDYLLAVRMECCN
jgi:hypothetical protein